MASCNKLMLSCVASCLFALLSSGCTTGGPSENGNNNDNNQGGNETPVDTTSKAFVGSASRGDVVVYTVDDEDQTYTWTNETTSTSGSGTFSALSGHPLAQGFFDLTEEESTYTALKLANDVFLTDNPTGHAENKLAVVLGSEATIDSSTAPGDYLYVYMDDDNTSVPWGTLRILEDGTLTHRSYGNTRPESAGTLEYEGTGTGTWRAIDAVGDVPGRTEFTVDGEILEGMFYDGKVVLVDRGEGEGMWIGVRMPAVPLTVPEIVGTYQFMDLAIDETGGFTTEIGLYDFLDDSTVDFASLVGPDLTNPDDWNTGRGLPVASVENVNNLFKVTGASPESTFEAYVLFVPGEFIIHFDFSSNVFTGYGVGVWQAN